MFMLQGMDLRDSVGRCVEPMLVSLFVIKPVCVLLYQIGIISTSNLEIRIPFVV